MMLRSYCRVVGIMGSYRAHLGYPNVGFESNGRVVDGGSQSFGWWHNVHI